MSLVEKDAPLSWRFPRRHSSVAVQREILGILSRDGYVSGKTRFFSLVLDVFGPRCFFSRSRGFSFLSNNPETDTCFLSFPLQDVRGRHGPEAVRIRRGRRASWNVPWTRRRNYTDITLKVHSHSDAGRSGLSLSLSLVSGLLSRCAKLALFLSVSSRPRRGFPQGLSLEESL